MREGRVLSRRRPSRPSSAKRSCQRQTQNSISNGAVARASSDVIGFGAYDEHRDAQIFQSDNAALDGKTAGGKPVLQKQAAEIANA
jgi:hypothetical protein